ncbi:TPA: hypothetical protein OT027_004630 [Klebsiella quasipneumoniae]|uniref:hypothetical protein n=1 Tax=Klebsiella pneumoniae TaxID=573 RepID=UPI000E2A637E|nr:hypothetical protein [Klebsiella pneumoniae]SWL28563.1 Uncharacterised protein [Klebsiella pneumoniae]HBR4841468.1 hypothetical protein [Klebsiella pneumoniae]HCT5345200.1 hypothetical protein [Klebsiella quasipneumoniae]HDE2730233.1 hypothetical protein [Klebsiella pneumoniae]
MSEDKDSIKDVSDELTKPFVDELSSRLKIPFFGGFVFSWLVINWERVAILISSKENIYTRIDKIKKIEEFNWPIIGDWHTSTFFAPLLYSIIITSLTPFITLGFKKIQKWANIRIIDTQVELNHRYQLSSASEQLKLETKEKEISEVKYSTTDIIQKHNNLISIISDTESKLKQANDELSEKQSELENIIEATTKLKSEFEGYKKPSDLVDQIQKVNEHQRDNLIKANKIISEYESNITTLTQSNSNLKREISSLHNRLIEVESNYEVSKNELNSNHVFINEMLTDIEIIIHKLKQESSPDEIIKYLLGQMELWEENLKSKLYKVNQVTSIE